MTARDRARRLQLALASVVVARAVLAAVGVALVVVAFGLGIGAASALAILVFLFFARPLLAARSLERVALWVEERHPPLAYALVSAIERAGPGGAALEREALRVPWWEIERRRLLRTLLIPALACALALLLATHPPARRYYMPSVAIERVVHASGRTVDPLRTLRATLRAPAYAGGGLMSLDDPASVDALPGSTIRVGGEGDVGAVQAAIDSVSRPIAPRSGGWAVEFTMPVRPAVLRLRSAGRRERLIVIAPIADAPPAVTLLAPARDTVVRAATGRLTLRAQLRDDIGLRDAAFEVIVSSGQEESFTFRSMTIGRVAFSGTRDAALTASLRLDSLALGPGDVLHVRAAARDGNTVTGPGFGASETRALRVARAGEYDSLSVEGAAPGDPKGELPNERVSRSGRVYLRGRPPTVIVDVAHARLAGKEKGASSVREPRPVGDPVARRRAESFARATALLATDASAAADTLLLMRVGALGDAPSLAALLDTAARAVRRRDAARIPLLWTRLRRALGGAPVRVDGVPLWTGAP